MIYECTCMHIHTAQRQDVLVCIAQVLCSMLINCRHITCYSFTLHAAFTAHNEGASRMHLKKLVPVQLG
jgi:hypothetical protein